MTNWYGATKMTGRDRHEQVTRAKYVKAILRQYDINLISPILEENVEDVPGPLVNDNEARLRYFWARDKEIIRKCHGVLVDGAQEKSFGVEREIGLSRYLWWKPTVLLMPNPGLSVASIEDDFITDDIHKAGAFIREKWGTPEKRIWWRLKLLIRCLPKRIIGEFDQWG